MGRCPEKLEKFLESAGEAPVVFTLGSAVVAVLAAGDFYEQSAKAAKKLGVRAVLLIGSDARNRPKGELPDSPICVAEYAPYSKLFPRVSLAVHPGRSGDDCTVPAGGAADADHALFA